MDHLPLPPEAKLTKIQRVPYVCSQAYDGGPFLEYHLRIIPPREDFAPAVLQDSSLWPSVIDTMSSAELEDLVQTWLFFGLANEILGAELTKQAIKVEEDDSETRFVSSTGLYEAGRDWIASIQSAKLAASEVQQLADRYAACFDHTVNWLWAIHRCIETKTLCFQNRAFNMLIIYSVIAVAEVLDHTIKVAFGWDRRRLLKGVNEFPFGLNVENGWCPNEIAANHSAMSRCLAVSFYLQHMKCTSPPGTHERCTAMECRALQCDLESYQPAHTNQQCTCSPIRADKTQITSALQRGTYPLIRISTSDPPHIDVVPATAGIAYIAISHVWTDGLGNPRENAMHSCQIDSLAAMVYSLKERMLREDPSCFGGQSEIYLFIDTLTFPTFSEDLKTVALGQMRAIYQNAAAVLVLDSSLSDCQFSEDDACYVAARIRLSRWGTRLWTFQEGVLARDLWFQFQNQTANMYQIELALQNSRDGLDKHSVMSFDFLSNLREMMMYDRNVKKHHPLESVAHGVWSRRCTVPSDESICLSTLLKLDAEDVAGAPADCRMQRMWQNMDKSSSGIPSEIIGYNYPRVDQVGFRWAPRSLLRTTEYRATDRKLEFTAPDLRADITPCGLHVRVPGYKITTPWLRILVKNFVTEWAGIMFLRDDHGSWFQAVSLNQPGDIILIRRMLFGREPAYVILVDTPNRVSLPSFTQLSLGVCGSRATFTPDSHIFIKTEVLLGIQPIAHELQKLWETAYSIGMEILHDPAAELPSLLDEGMVDYEAPKNKEYWARLEASVIRRAQDVMPSNPELERTSISSEGRGVTGLAQCIFLVLSGCFKIISCEFPQDQDWIVD